MNRETVLAEKNGSAAVITLNRPQKMNALNAQLLIELGELLEQYESDSSVSALVLTGSGKAFCAGGDISVNEAGEDDLANFIKFSCLTRDTLHKVEIFKKPVIAAINGFAFGGGIELALCCDLRVASEKAKMGLTEVKLGVVPGAGGTQRLPRLIGMAMAKQLMFTGGIIDGTEAYRIGLVNIVTPQEECLARALQLAEEIASMAPLAVQATKKCINMSLQVDLESGLSYEAECVRGVFTSADRLEGGNAFREKRPPVWKGR
ncbi:MAG: enoyl-CoA hydratase-related protein [Firmicutes bacterium]|nr:enoyl-CoA hydratase-related protein [Bacillota bacterium]